MPITSSSQATVESENNQSYVFPLILVTSLFLLWGLAYGLLDVLNKHFQETLHITKQRSTLLQAAYFGAYFLMAIPAGSFMRKAGYKKGIITGLIMYAIGAFLFFPSAAYESFSFFLISVFVLASGLTFLETAANPYVTVLGNPKTSAFRLNLSQSFNGVGSFIGPIIGAKLFFVSQAADSTSNLDSVKFVYIIIGAVVLVVAFLFSITSLPEINASFGNSSSKGYEKKNLLLQTHFKWAVVAQFFYVAAQVGSAALFINYCTEKNLGIDNENASYLLSASLFLFTVGRFVGTFLMKFILPQNLLSVFAAINVILCVAVVFVSGYIAVYSLMAIFFFNSIMFPTIFALGVKDLGEQTKQGASFIIMAIVGGAVVPYVMGSFQSTAVAYTVPMICFIFVFIFGIYGSKIRSDYDESL
jgi:FHS family L-fucose permease-like MFS transporter